MKINLTFECEKLKPSTRSMIPGDWYVVGHKYGMRRVCMIRPPNPEEVIFMDGNYTSTSDIHTNYELVGKVSSIDATVNLV